MTKAHGRDRGIGAKLNFIITVETDAIPIVAIEIEQSAVEAGPCDQLHKIFDLTKKRRPWIWLKAKS